MYVETRAHTQNPAHLTAASVTVLALALVGYGLVAGLAAPVLGNLPKPLQAVIMPDPVIDEPLVPPMREIDTVALTTPFPAPPLPAPIPYPEDAPDTRIAAGPAEAKPGPSATGVIEPVPATRPAAPPSAPKLLARETPPYPPTEIRARNEGVTSLAVCIDARGRVSEATVTASSGHRRLDEAALKWIRAARFSPAKQDGAPVEMCNFPVDYEWRLENAR